MTTIVAIISSFISAALGWLISRHKTKAEVKQMYANVEKSELENVIKAVSIWRGIAEDLANQVKQLSIKCTQLTDDIEKLRQQNRLLKIEIKKLEKSLDNNLKASNDR